MSIADAIYWENEFSNNVNTVWKDPQKDLPEIIFNDPDIKNLQTSKIVLVKIQRSENSEPYVALAKYTSMTDENSDDTFQWKVEHHSGNWNEKVVGWYSIPTAGE